MLAVTNVMGSQATRDADGVLFTRAGLEIGVAATKTFVTQVAVMYLLGLRMAELRGTLPLERIAELVAGIKHLPHEIDRLIAEVEPQVEADRRGALQGRVLPLPRPPRRPARVALEGALKLKEISYIATDAYAAGEMKHGPIALLDERTPVVCVATDSPVLDKVVSNIQEVRARGAHVIAVATEGNDAIERARRARVLRAAHATGCCSRILAVIPLQLLAYHDRAPARAERRSAAQPGQDGHGRVATGADLVRERDGAAHVAVRVKPRGGRDGVEGVVDGRLVLRVSAPPVEGRANAAVERLVADALGVPKGRVAVVSGQKAREKLVRVEGLSAAEARARLGV